MKTKRQIQEKKLEKQDKAYWKKFEKHAAIEKKVSENIYKELKKSFDELINIEIDEYIIYDDYEFLNHIELFSYELQKYYEYKDDYDSWFKLINKCMEYYNNNFKNKKGIK